MSSNTEQLKAASLPESFQAKLFDLTGSNEGGNKGFVCFYVNDAGRIATIQRTENEAIALALQKAIEIHSKAVSNSLEDN